MSSHQHINFQKFSSKQDAVFLLNLLQVNGVEAIIENSSPSVDITFSMNNMQHEFIVKIIPSYFEKANLILEEQAKKNIKEISKDHYLFEFTKQELIEILEKPDEWSIEDYLLAQHILGERGENINKEKIEELKQKRLFELRKPEEVKEGWILVGYIMALFGGIIGVFIGWFHWTFKKTDPLGKRFYVYDEKTRKRGKQLFYFGIILQLIWIILFIKYGF